jgi:hypothetical protein
MSTPTTIPADLAARFIRLCSGELADEVATALSCSEVDSLAAMLRALGQDDLAEVWIAAHAEGDESGDAHYTGAED